MIDFLRWYADTLKVLHKEYPRQCHYYGPIAVIIGYLTYVGVFFYGLIHLAWDLIDAFII